MKPSVLHSHHPRVAKTKENESDSLIAVQLSNMEASEFLSVTSMKCLYESVFLCAENRGIPIHLLDTHPPPPAIQTTISETVWKSCLAPGPLVIKRADVIQTHCGP